MEYWSVQQTAEVWGVSARRVQKLCKEGRIAGLTRFGRSWMIPRGTQKPKDPRLVRREYGREEGE